MREVAGPEAGKAHGREPGAAATPESGARRAHLLAVAERYALVAIWALLVIGFSIGEPDRFPTLGNVANIFGSQAVLFVLTMAVLIPLVHGDFDLSLGAAAGLCAMTIALLNVQHHVPVVAACAAGLLAALAVGAVNGFFIVRLGNDPFIVTLGTMTVVIGVVYAISGGATVGIVSAQLTSWIFTRELLGIPVEFYYGVGILLVVWYVLGMTPIGQRALFVGQSRDVARLSGIRVGRARYAAFLAGGLIAGVAGILYIGTTGSADPATGQSLLLPAYAAAFLGSTSIRPGRFNAPGAAVAVYFLATGVAGLQLLGAQDYVQQLFYGGALVIAVTLSQPHPPALSGRPRPCGVGSSTGCSGEREH